MSKLLKTVKKKKKKRKKEKEKRKKKKKKKKAYYFKQQTNLLQIIASTLWVNTAWKSLSFLFWGGICLGLIRRNKKHLLVQRSVPAVKKLPCAPSPGSLLGCLDAAGWGEIDW